MADQQPPGEGEFKDRVAFDYIKSQHFRVIRADGAIGGITPNGNIHFALYSERQAIPRRHVFELDETGRIGRQIESETLSRDAIVREMEVDVFLNVAAARSFCEWLGNKIRELEGVGYDASGDGAS